MPSSIDISVAIPDSCLSDEQTLLGKTLKLGQIARASSIFNVRTIYLYQDRQFNSGKSDRKLIKLILKYLDTPQYLRKLLFPRMSELKYTGMLPPIRAPHHKDWQDVKSVREGEIRVGVVVSTKGKLFVDVGLGHPIQFEGDAPIGKKLNLRIKSSYPNLRAEEVDQTNINQYWGFKVDDARSLHSLLTHITNSVLVITSRQGVSLKKLESRIQHELKFKQTILIVFGSPRRGVHEILSDEGFNFSSYPFVVNMFPFQGTRTVRLEEAFLGALAIINYYLYS
jgi:predicted SPOUT superfamily RNA methylase MTH1